MKNGFSEWIGFSAISLIKDLQNNIFNCGKILLRLILDGKKFLLFRFNTRFQLFVKQAFNIFPLLRLMPCQTLFSLHSYRFFFKQLLWWSNIFHRFYMAYPIFLYCCIYPTVSSPKSSCTLHNYVLTPDLSDYKYSISFPQNLS